MKNSSWKNLVWGGEEGGGGKKQHLPVKTHSLEVSCLPVHSLTWAKTHICKPFLSLTFDGNIIFKALIGKQWSKKGVKTNNLELVSLPYI